MNGDVVAFLTLTVAMVLASACAEIGLLDGGSLGLLLLSHGSKIGRGSVRRAESDGEALERRAQARRSCRRAQMEGRREVRAIVDDDQHVHGVGRRRRHW
jgi:hypothetical protein